MREKGRGKGDATLFPSVFPEAGKGLIEKGSVPLFWALSGLTPAVTVDVMDYMGAAAVYVAEDVAIPALTKRRRTP